MEKIYKIAELIQRYLVGDVNEAEKRKVEKWLLEDIRHQEMMDEFEKCNWEKLHLLKYEVFDVQQEYERFRRSKYILGRRRLMQRCSSIAAGILLVIGIAFYVVQKEEIINNNGAIVDKMINPGRSRAILVLGNGNRFVLNDSVKMELLEQDAKIKIEGAELSYQSSTFSQHVEEIEPSFNTVITPRGGEYKLVLADGTRVWINAESELLFPARFVGKERNVYIKGEAYFEVAKDSLHPFLIHTPKAIVQVVGTSFNISAYPEEPEQTTLLEGLVDIYCQGKILRIMPKEQWVFNEQGGSVKTIDPRIDISWKNGDFAFENQQLRIVLRELERWYDMRFLVENEEVDSLRFTGIFPKYGDLNRVLEIIELATCVKFKKDNLNIITVTK